MVFSTIWKFVALFQLLVNLRLLQLCPDSGDVERCIEGHPTLLAMAGVGILLSYGVVFVPVISVFFAVGQVRTLRIVEARTQQIVDDEARLLETLKTKGWIISPPAPPQVVGDDSNV